MDQNDDYLVHYGVLGMKWGIRKDRDRVGHRRHSNSSDKKNTSKSETERLNEAILKKNPNAAVLNPEVAKKAKKELTEEERKARNKKIALGVLAGVGTVAVVAAIAYVANHHNGVKLDNINARWGAVEVDRMKDDLKKRDFSDFIDGWANIGDHRYKSISLDEYNNLGKNDLHLKKGTLFQRISMQKEQFARDNTYVAFGSDDKNRYQAFLPGMWKVNGRMGTDAYRVVMEAGEEIRSPSAKKRVDILETVFKKNPELAQKAALSMRTSTSAGSEGSLARKFYNRMATGLCDRNNEFSKAYVKEVLSQGYNAIIDDNDAGRLAKNPLILLTGSKSIKSVTSTKITGKEMLDAAAKVNKQAFDVKNQSLPSYFDKQTRKFVNDYYLKAVAEVARANGGVSPAVASRISALKNAGKTIEEIAKMIDVAESTVQEYLH